MSGVLCAFRKAALEQSGWWSSHTLTEDIDVTWRMQLAGWRVVYEPRAIVWILMPETLRGLWRQRLRWAQGGSQMMLDYFRPVMRLKEPSLLPTYLNYILSVVWAYAIADRVGRGSAPRHRHGLERRCCPASAWCRAGGD